MSSMVQVEVLRAACCVAGADGETTDEELELLRRLARQTGVGRASLDAMIDRACCDSDFCNEQFRVLKAEPKEAMAILLEVGMADGVVASSELKTLQVFAQKLSVPEEIFVKLVEAARELVTRRPTDN